MYMTSRATQYCLAGRMRPVGRRLESPGLNNQIKKACNVSVGIPPSSAICLAQEFSNENMMQIILKGSGVIHQSSLNRH